VVPEAVEVGAKRLDARRIQLVEAAVAIGPIDYQVRVLQDSQVLRDGWAADGETTRQFADRLRSLKEPLEDGPPGRIAQRIQLSSMLVSNH